MKIQWRRSRDRGVWLLIGLVAAILIGCIVAGQGEGLPLDGDSKESFCWVM